MERLKEPINDVKIILINKKCLPKKTCFMKTCHRLIDRFGEIGHKHSKKPKLII